MATINESSRVTNLLTAATATGAGDTIATNSNASDRKITAVVAGTGAVSATVKLYGGNGSTFVLLATITLSGTTSDNFALVTVPYPEMYADLTAVSGTGAAVTVQMGV